MRMAVVLYSGNLEPSLEELLNDPIAALIMARDRITPDIVWSQVREAKQKLRCREARRQQIAREDVEVTYRSRA